jgi:hypothetical protein
MWHRSDSNCNLFKLPNSSLRFLLCSHPSAFLVAMHLTLLLSLAATALAATPPNILFIVAE